ncbi:protein kinase domain-containing protein [Nannocystaceae bacterium ST9]
MVGDEVTGTRFESKEAERPDFQRGLERGQTISRYLLVDRVGAGGMGVVWAAYDPELDRRVAVKLLRLRRSGADVEELRTRLLREAQAMARLAHPNVIAVHDVGQHEGQVFLAMEFVEGQTLAGWLKSSGARRTWQQVVGMFVQAGRGLAAAHRAGLVHRDFKPDNVLVGDDDGRARVTDFGLARSVEGETLDGESEPPGPRSLDERTRIGASSPMLDSPLTRTGTMLGTPAYMAPEQFSEGHFDARSDQFSFCVALWEALFQQRPFAGRTVVQLSEAVVAGQISSPPSEARVPGFVERALRRGLSVEPGDRWPDIDALLHALEHDPAIGRRRWLVAGTLAACVLGLVIAPMLVGPPDQTPPLCSDAERHLEGVWDSERRHRLGEALAREQAIGEILPVVRVLDQYALDWQAMYVDACQATHVRGEQSAELLDRRMQCLDERKASLSAAVELLASGERRAAARVDKLLAALPPIESCGNRSFLLSRVPVPADPVLAATVADIRVRTAEARARVEVGDNLEPSEQLERLLAEAERLDYPPLRAELLTELAFAQSSSAPASEVRDRLELAVAESIRTGQDAYAARAGTELIFVIGVRLGDPEQGLRWAPLVRAWHDRIGADANARALVRVSEGVVLLELGRRDQAKALLDDSLRVFGIDETLVGFAELAPRDRLVASFALGGLAQIAHADGDHHRTHLLLDRHHEQLLRFFDADSDLVRQTAVDLGSVTMVLGDWTRSAALLDPIAARTEPGRSFAPDPATNLATVVSATLALGRADVFGPGPQRERELERARELIDRPLVLDPSADLGLVARALANRARLARLVGDFESAERLLVEALAEHADAPPHARVVIEAELGRIRLERGEPSEALLTLAAASRTGIEAGIESSPIAAMILTDRGRALARLGRVPEAMQELDAARALLAALAPEGHPLELPILAALIELEPGRASEHRAAAERIRERLVD